MTVCPACLEPLERTGLLALAAHLVERAGQSDPDHVRWLNQNLTRQRSAPAELVPGLQRMFALGPGGVKEWIQARFIAKFYGKNPHPFVLALQHPSRSVLLGYVIEHQHFLRQWVRSCAYIMARTDQTSVVHYELDNLTTEFGGFGPDRVSHYELLLRMGESLGVPRATVLGTPPLPPTRRAIDAWNQIATRRHWLAGLAAMHSLELIANRNVRALGATMTYFDPAILHSTEISDAAKQFLREGYEADVGHSDEALDLVMTYAVDPELVAEVQSTVLRSLDLFDDYLMARLERGTTLKRNFAGCAICDSTWGDVWEEVDGERMFFCCSICAAQFRGLVERLKQETGWSQIESIEIQGDRRGRICTATNGTQTVQVDVTFDPDGQLMHFERRPPP